jgi:hypothetical protein
MKTPILLCTGLSSRLVRAWFQRFSLRKARKHPSGKEKDNTRSRNYCRLWVMVVRGEASILRLSFEIVSKETLRMQRQLFSPAGAFFMHDSAGK